jgi:flagellar capping protein FliD
MGSDLQLTGLASGFDWAPVVDQLIELERIPQKRLEQEKVKNEEKISDLGILKTQLDTLKSAAKALQDDNLFKSRKVGLSSSNQSNPSVSAEADSLTGEFSVQVLSKASSTEMTSKNRYFKGLGNPIGTADDTFDSSLKLKDLPLQNKISTGTFTISGKTFSISSLDATLEDVVSMINDSSSEGLNPEGTDGTGINLTTFLLKINSLSPATTIKFRSGICQFWARLQIHRTFSLPLKLDNPNLKSSQALGSIDMSKTLENANFGKSFSGLNAGKLGTFFIGEGEGVQRIDYDITVDTVSTLVQKVNSSDANVYMFYDPVSDRFVVRNKNTGATGITMHESSTWDAISSNKGSGNILELMGLASPSSISDEYISGSGVSIAKGDYFKFVSSGNTSYWQALDDGVIGDPNLTSGKWRQVIEGVGRSINSEIGGNSSVRVNNGELVYSKGNNFSDDEHGYKGINFDISSVSLGGIFDFTVGKDSSAAKGAIDKFVVEFNDAQEYIKSLVSVTNDGENVTAGRFSSNTEMSRLGSQLRKVVFGESTPHSASPVTKDNSDFILNEQTRATLVSINSDPSSELMTLKAELSLGASNNGYLVKVLSDTMLDSSGNPQTYYKYNSSSGLWEEADPAFSSFRLSDIGLDFGVGSDNLKTSNSALLIQALEDQPDMVQSLFDQDKVTRFDSLTKSDRPFRVFLKDWTSSFPLSLKAI